MITVSVGTQGERQDVIAAFRAGLGSTIPFQVLLNGRLTDSFPCGWAGTHGVYA